MRPVFIVSAWIVLTRNIISVLETTFGKADYKGKQKEIVEAAVLGADIFVGAPTGMGKVRVVLSR